MTARAVGQASFAGLPAELRGLIYDELLKHPAALFCLLTVSRRIFQEVQPYIFKLPITFNGQKDLFKWLSRMDHGFLPYVGTIRFKLHDIDPQKIVDSLGERLRRADIQEQPQAIGDPYGEACDLELEQIMSAFRTFSNLRSITILKGSNRDPQPPKTMEEKLVKLILQGLPLISSLTVPHKKFCPPNEIVHMSIQQLQVTSYAFNCLPEALTWISNFPGLTEFQICGFLERACLQMPPFLKWKKSNKEPNKALPQLHEVTLCLHNLERLRLFDMERVPALEHFLNSLRYEATSLKRLKFRCTTGHKQSLWPSRKWWDLVRSPSLTHIETSYQWTPTRLSQYPKSIVSIGVHFGLDHHFFPQWTEEFLDDGPPSEFPNLQEIVSYFNPEPLGCDWKHAPKASPAFTAACKKYGIRVLIIYDDFVCGSRLDPL
ncbi:MAG: hypothetical protein Q9219_000554 [cf. Caloplaca sp. 3 TL-2023]